MDKVKSGQCCVWSMLRLVNVASGQCCVWSMLRLVNVASGQFCVWSMLGLVNVSSGQCCVWSMLPLVNVASGCIRHASGLRRHHQCSKQDFNTEDLHITKIITYLKTGSSIIWLDIQIFRSLVESD